MIPKRKAPEEKTTKTSIVIKMLLSTLFFTIIPLIISGLLIVYAYQSLINELLTERGVEFSEGVIKGLSLALQGAEIQAFLTLLIVVVLSLFSNIIISRNLTRPLKKLLKGTDEVAKGNLDFKIEIESKDELGKLSAQFNKMTRQLKEAKVSLEKAKTVLETKVKERTKELEKTAEALGESKIVLEIKVRARTQELEELAKNLEGQVKQRTKELQEKIQELEKFQKFAVGREIKMVELKEEIKRLQKQLKEEKPS